MTTSSTGKTITRESNIELLRIICMLLIVLNHFLEPHCDIQHAVQQPFGEILRMLCMPAVNTFILISGYFGIRLKLRSTLHLYLMCAFYGLIGYLVYIITTDAHIGFSLIKNSIFIFSHNTWWFISGYLYLMLLSPILNAAIEHMSQRTHLVSLCLMGIATCYFGWMQHTELFNHDAFCFDQFLIIYMIGAYMRKYYSQTYYDEHRKLHFILFAGLTTAYILLDHIPFTAAYLPGCYQYNSPFCILAAVGLMGYTLSFHIHSHVINYIASSALAAYLLQDQHYLGQHYIYPHLSEFYTWIETYYPNHTHLYEPLIAIGLTIIFFTTAIIIDKVREVIMQPIWWGYKRLVHKYPLLDKHITI